MRDRLDNFIWFCYKDKQPENNMIVYVYFPGETGVDVGLANDYEWDDDMYWCYVFIPDAPRVEKKDEERMSLEERVSVLEQVVLRLL